MSINYPIVNGSDFRTFNSPEESIYYSQCISHLVLTRISSDRTISEFGSGDGSPVVNALLRSPYQGKVQGYELNSVASMKANALITECNLQSHYAVSNESFFEAASSEERFLLICNPPFLPAETDNIKDPLLWGGKDGSDVYMRLLEMQYESVMLMIASYSNPEKIIFKADQENYDVCDFLIAPVTIGEYSREKPVWSRLMDMKQRREAYFTNSHFLLAGVFFEKRKLSARNLTSEVLSVITAMKQ